ncbi:MULTISPECIES: DUF6680 family protein [unclassified Pseudomonas]|uniref:DUF6680 family protein n=1 Tax=unclassified Pseudomonas TaxID=196821 RepID=UPI000C88402D|nr:MULTISPECIES: DUF6680 family protein [unclassified Pseudomonas]PMZ90483.1 hypothetical protein C1X61_08515 [Pseudomonas sp. FW215-T2]PNA13285.1 hypothetical protein C1X62_10865 [Pseudomonas sp. FW215-R3]PNB37956.1 hypothetical protein C1X63_09700 [Pseudomonas sp. FW305-131]
MTPEALAQAQLNLAQWQLWVTAAAIFAGPLFGVVFTLWFQSRKDKIEARRKLFLTLVAERKGLLISQQVAQALNTIDVVYADSPNVKSLWHKYYALLSQPPSQERDHTWIELIGAMSQELSYTKFSQTDIDKFYIPQGHADDIEFQRKISQQWSRVLENTEHLNVVSRKYEKDSPPGI